MKKKYLYVEFAVIFIFLAIPPLFPGKVSVTESKMVIGNSFSVQATVQLLVSVALILQNRKFPFTGTGNGENSKQVKILTFMKWIPICFGFLMVSQATVTGLSLVCKATENQKILFPANFPQWIFYFINLFIGVLYEETVYRLFLPDTLQFLAGEKRKLNLLCEFLCIMIFAFSHRYLGIMPVVNAAMCGFVLRFTKIKSKSLIPSTVAHTLYNITQTALLFFIY